MDVFDQIEAAAHAESAVVDAEARGAAAERARIRRELLAELEGVKHIARESFLPMIDRICSEPT